MTTAAELINGSLRLLGVLAEGETPSADTANDALVALNQMLDSWSTERLAVFSTATQKVAWPVNQASATLGPGGTLLNSTRPLLIDDSSFFHDPSTGIDYPLVQVSQEDYNSIALKSVTSTFPNIMFVNVGMPLTTLYVYPIPTLPLEFNIVSTTPLTAPADLGTELVFPPGYLRAIRYNLAKELGPEFGEEPSATVIKIAVTSKRNLKRINQTDDTLDMPIMPGLGNRSGFNIYAGNF